MFGKSLFGKAIHLAVLIMIVMIMTACMKKVPLEMVPFGTLDRDDYRILHESCSQRETVVDDSIKVESMIPYVAHYIKVPSFAFTAVEFKDKSAIASLCKSIKDDQYNVKLSAPTDTIEWLNELVRIPDLYDRILERKKGPYSVDVQQLVQMTNNYRKTKKFIDPNPIPKLPDDLMSAMSHTIIIKSDELNDYEKTAIRKLNRLLLEELYPDKVPKSLEKGRIIDWENATVAIPDFKILEGNITEAAVKQSCDDMAKYLQEWKVFKKVVRTVTPDTDLIMQGTIVRYKAVEGMEKAAQFLTGGLFGSQLSRKYAYCFLEIKWVDARTGNKIGAMMVNYVYTVGSVLQRGHAEIFLVDRFYYIFNLLIKSRSQACIDPHPDLTSECDFRDKDFVAIMNPKKWKSD